MMAVAKYNLFSVLCIFLSSCAFLSSDKREYTLPEDQTELVSRDFVAAIARLRGFNPRETTVQFRNPTTPFSTELHDAMRRAGFGIQIIKDNERASNHVHYVSRRYESAEGTTVAYEVSVGSVKLSREYEIRAGRVFPIAALSIKGGVQDGNQRVDNSIFRAVDPVIDNPVMKSVITSDSNSVITTPNTPELSSLQGSTLALLRKNVADIGSSNFREYFKHFNSVRSETLVFPNDSLRLGRPNKKTIWSVAQQFDAATDIISVLGCSHGATKIDNGNALLATGRASRVKEELIMSNISPEKILDEGCWAPTYYKDFPRRGVVLTLRTKIK